MVLRRLLGVSSTATDSAEVDCDGTFLVASVLAFLRLVGVETGDFATASRTGFAILVLVVAGMLSECSWMEWVE